MGQTGYKSTTVVVGSVKDSILIKPSGSGDQTITPTIPAAIAQTAADTLPSPAAAFYTKTSSTVLVLTLTSTPTFTSGSLMGIFWEGTDGSYNYCLDCTVSIAGGVVTITAPTLSAAQLACGMLYFNGAATTGAGDVSGKKILPGTTEVTFSVATLATSDQPGNPDLAYSLPIANVEQLLVTADVTGAVEFIETATAVFAWNYGYPGNFYSYINGYDSAPWAGTVTSLRFYNSAIKSQTISVGALMA